MSKLIISQVCTSLLLISFPFFENYAQCPISSGVGLLLTTDQINDGLGQSFTTTCSAGEFNSIQITTTTNNTDVTVSIYEGKGFGGTLLYSRSDVGWNINPPIPEIVHTIDLTTGPCNPCNRSYNANGVYTFRFSGAPGFQLLRYTDAPYSGGERYNHNGTAVNSEDLYFQVSASGSVLPVELTNFDAQLQNGQAILKWTTASELNNAGWELERSADGQRWKTLDFVLGNGTTSEAHDYKYVDAQPLPGTNYYRLRQLDFDGNMEYSPVKAVTNDAGGWGITVSPNPVSPGSELKVAGLDKNAGTLLLLDLYGRTVWESSIFENPSLAIPLAGDLPKGMYSLVMLSHGEKSAKRVVVQ